MWTGRAWLSSSRIKPGNDSTIYTNNSQLCVYLDSAHRVMDRRSTNTRVKRPFVKPHILSEIRTAKLRVIPRVAGFIPLSKRLFKHSRLDINLFGEFRDGVALEDLLGLNEIIYVLTEFVLTIFINQRVLLACNDIELAFGLRKNCGCENVAAFIFVDEAFAFEVDIHSCALTDITGA